MNRSRRDSPSIAFAAWSITGTERTFAERLQSSVTPEFRYIELAHVREFAHAVAVRMYGREEPMPEWESVDEGKLLSALATPLPVFGEEAYPKLADKAAVLLYSIAKAHALPNGNKRLALTSTFLFLAASQSRLRSLVLDYMSKYLDSRLAPLADLAADVVKSGATQP